MDITQRLTLDDLPEFIFGAEGDEDASNGASTDSSTDDQGGAGGASDDASGDADDHDDDDDNEHDDRNDPKVKGLRDALKAERRRANTAERAAKAAAKEKDERELAEKSAIEQAETRAQRATERLQKLSDGYRKSAIDRAIEKAASDFIDPNDAVTTIDRSLIEVEQDDEDPSIVKVDAKSVTRAVKALAAEKSHWLKKPGTDDGKPSGSGFGGSKRTDTEQSREAALRDKYRI